MSDMTHTFRHEGGVVTLWTLEQVELVRSARQRVMVDLDPVYLASFGPDAEEGVLAALCRAFQRTVREALSTYALDDEPHAVDLVTVRRPEEDRGPGAFSIVASWRPLVQEAELVGGELDGEVYAVRDPLSLGSLRVPQRDTRRPMMADADRPYERGPRPLTYTLSGWNNTERRWRYSLEATR